MMTVNPYTTLAESVPSVVIQGFVLIMLALIFFGTVIQMIHHKNITYFFNNAKKAKLSAERELGTGHKAAIIAKTVVHDIATTAELGIGKRRVAHVLGMWGTILFWVASVVMIFCYSSADAITPEIVNFMATNGRGLICLALESEKCKQLKLKPMTSNNKASNRTAFTVSIEAKDGITTGISAKDRAHTITTAVNKSATNPKSATWNIGASSSLFIATITLLSFIPAKC